MFKKISIFIFILSITFAYLPHPLQAAFNLIKTPNSATVFYLDENNIRHAFPNEMTFRSWFGQDFSQVMIMSDDYVQSLPLGKNITLKPGKFLVKIPSSPRVYAVEPGGTLRHITTATVADKIYGAGQWQKKIIDLPEVFFENYVIGEPIEHEHQIPDGVVYKLLGQENYYYKIKGHVKKFASLADVLANGYGKDNVVEGITKFLLHGKVINGFASSINEILSERNLAHYDCENKNLKGAFIFVYENNFTSTELEKIKQIKNRLPDFFKGAADSLSELFLDKEIFLLKKNDYHLFQNSLSLNQVAYDFYDEHKDVYDFLFVFDNFSAKDKVLAEHHLVTNQIKGINKPILRAEVQFGSLGKLKGLVHIFNINNQSWETEVDKNNTLNNLAHEILHQWSGSLIFLNENNEDDLSLLKKDRAHWSNYVNFISPLGGLGWQENKDGTFSISSLLGAENKLSNLDLYALGLLPKQAVGEIFYLIPENEMTISPIKAKKVEVPVESLVRAMGEWECGK